MPTTSASAASATAASMWSTRRSSRPLARGRPPARGRHGPARGGRRGGRSPTTKDAARFEKAAPHIKELIACDIYPVPGARPPVPGGDRPRAVGRRRSAPARRTRPEPSLSAAGNSSAKLRASALNHLKIAAAQLPDVAEAQARYGVALILAQEQSLGRQYLQNALRLGNLDPQYQIWAAWSMVQAGYPEEAEPIVDHLLERDRRGPRAAASWRGRSTCSAARSTRPAARPTTSRRRSAEYDRSIAGTGTARGHPAPPGADRRPARPARAGPEAASRRLRAQGQGGPAAEHLAVLILRSRWARPTRPATPSTQARKRYPRQRRAGRRSSRDSSSRDKKPKEADRVLAEFLAHDPENVSIVLHAGPGPRRPARRRRGGPQAPRQRRRAERELGPPGPARPARPEAEGSTTRWPPRSPRSAAAGRKPRPATCSTPSSPSTRGTSRDAVGAFRRGPQERPEQQDRPVLEGPARQPHRRRRRGGRGASRRSSRDGRPRSSTPACR